MITLQYSSNDVQRTSRRTRAMRTAPKPAPVSSSASRSGLAERAEPVEQLPGARRAPAERLEHGAVGRGLGAREGGEGDAPARAEHAAELGERRRGPIQEDEDEVAGGGIEAPVTARERLGVAPDEGHAEGRDPLAGVASIAGDTSRPTTRTAAPGVVAAAAATSPVPVPTSRNRWPRPSAQAARRSGTKGSSTRAIARS